MIKIDNITFSYDNKEIFNNASINIEPGKITYIIGKNGTGKSTLSYLLTNLLSPMTGTIYLDDYILCKKSTPYEIKKKISIVFQNPDNSILFNTVYDNLKFILENMKVDKDNIDDIIKSSLKKVNMLDHINDNPFNLSGGEKQKISIASAIMLKSKYIIFDESTSMLDTSSKKDIYKLIRILKKEGIGIIFITNILEEIIYGDEVIIINNKKLLKYKVKDILKDYNILKDNNIDISLNMEIIKNINIKDYIKEYLK